MIIQSIIGVLGLILIAAIWYAWAAFPIISGYGAKNLCSAIFLQHRDPDQAIKEDLGEFPLSIGTFKVDSKDSSVTGSVGGFAKRKAIYREGLGCTLVNGLDESMIRAQKFYLPSWVDNNQDDSPWPTGNMVTGAVPPEINKVLLQTAVDGAMQSATWHNKTSATRSVIVLYKGNIVAEQYAPGFDKNTVQLGWSISKSLTAAMIGVLVKTGKINIDAPAPVKEWKDTKKEKITIRHLLQQTTGLDFKEDYANPSEVTNMLFKNGDMASFTAALPLKYEPGSVFNYSSGNTNILSRIIREAAGEKEYASFPYISLFRKINMNSLLLEPDASGTFIGSSYSYATARDFARFGLLYFNNGIWNGEQILPVDWVKESIKPSAADKMKQYGFQFWLNGHDEKNPGKRKYPDVPADMFYADGYGGQDIYIIPSKQLIVVRLGLHTIDENKFLSEVIQSIQD